MDIPYMKNANSQVTAPVTILVGEATEGGLAAELNELVNSK